MRKKKRNKLLQRLLSTVLAVCCVLMLLPAGSVAYASSTTGDAIPDTVTVNGVEYEIDPYIKELYWYADNLWAPYGPKAECYLAVLDTPGVPPLQQYAEIALDLISQNLDVRESLLDVFDYPQYSAFGISRLIHSRGLLFINQELRYDGLWDSQWTKDFYARFYYLPVVGIDLDYFRGVCEECAIGDISPTLSCNDNSTNSHWSNTYGGRHPYRHHVTVPIDEAQHIMDIEGEVSRNTWHYNNIPYSNESELIRMCGYRLASLQGTTGDMDFYQMLQALLCRDIAIGCIAGLGFMTRYYEPSYGRGSSFSRNSWNLYDTDLVSHRLATLSKLPVFDKGISTTGKETLNCTPLNTPLHMAGYIYNVVNDAENLKVELRGICRDFLIGECPQRSRYFTCKYDGMGYGQTYDGYSHAKLHIDFETFRYNRNKWIPTAPSLPASRYLVGPAKYNTCAPLGFMNASVSSITEDVKTSVAQKRYTVDIERCTFNDEGYCIYCDGKKPEPPVIEQVDPWANHSLKTDFVNDTHVDTSGYNFQYVPNDQLSEYDFSDTRSVAVRFYKKDPVTGKIEYFSEAPMEFDIGLQMKAPVTLEGVTGDTAYNRGYVWEIEGKDFTHEANNTNMTTNRLLDWGLLPDTGGVGTMLLSVVGSALITTSTILWCKRKRSLN